MKITKTLITFLPILLLSAGCSKTDGTDVEEIVEPICEAHPETQREKNFSLFGIQLGSSAKSVKNKKAIDSDSSYRCYSFDGIPPFDGNWEFNLWLSESSDKIILVKGICKCHDANDAFYKWKDTVKSIREKYKNCKAYTERGKCETTLDYNASIGNIDVECEFHKNEFYLSVFLSEK